MADKEVPAPVAPVTAFIWISLDNNLWAASGKIANCKAVAKQPGFAIYFASLIFSFCNSGNPYTNSFWSKFLSARSLKSLLKSIILVFVENWLFSKKEV